MSDETTLLPCPFCGGEAETLTAESMHGGYLFGIMCNDCRSRGDVYDTEAEAIATWNTRAELGSGTCEPNWILQGETQTQEFWRCECGNCGECFGVEDRSSFPFKMTIDKVDIPNFCPNCGARVMH